MTGNDSTRRRFLQTLLAGGALAGWPFGLAKTAEGLSAHPQLKIVSVETFHLRHQLSKSIGPSTGYYNQRQATLVKISTDAGLVGWGETATLRGVRALIEELGKTLIGKNPLRHRQLWRDLWGPNFGNGLAVGALDIALHDLWGKAVNLSVADLYGGRLRDRVTAYASAMNYTKGVAPETQYAPEALALVERGFKAMKMRLGGYPVARDAAVAASVREAVGPNVRLMADGNGAYALPGAIRMGRALESLGFYFFEEPLPQPKYAGYEVLTSALDIPIAAGEVVDARDTARELIARGAMRIIQPDATLCGGIRECLFIAEMARLWGIQCIPHCWGGAISLAAAMQVVSLLPDASWGRTTESPLLELDVYENPFRDKLTIQPATVRTDDGTVAVPAGPGLGVEVDEDVVKHYSVD